MMRDGDPDRLWHTLEGGQKYDLQKKIIFKTLIPFFVVVVLSL